MIANVYRFDKTNVGDLWSAPFIYFPKLKSTIYDLLTNFEISNHLIILGGGGLISPTFIDKIIQLSYSNKIISWGIGENWYINPNAKYYDGPKYFHPILNDFALTSVRDINSPYLHVPCVSCMHNVFKNTKSINRSKIGLYNHFRFKIPTQIDQITNYKGTIEDKINFIKNHEIIITNSYHGAYWSMLLNKKLIVVPFGSKFYGINENVVFEKPGNVKKNLDYDFPDYSGFLEKCINTNLNFYKRVEEML